LGGTVRQLGVLGHVADDSIEVASREALYLRAADVVPGSPKPGAAGVAPCHHWAFRARINHRRFAAGATVRPPVTASL